MTDPIAFLRARLDEDEQVALAAKPGPWQVDGGTVYARHPTDEIVDYTDSADHIARHDPTRVLADVAAKRQIIELVIGAYAGYAVLPLLALPYAGHPDYREDWKP